MSLQGRLHLLETVSRNRFEGARRRTTTQTQDLNMIPQRRVRECQDRWRKKHSLVIRVRNEQTNPLVP